MKCCIFCGKQMVDESPEHIILKAFGGRRKTRQVICSLCNNKFGNTIDKGFAEDYIYFRNRLNILSGDGNPPPILRNVKLKDGTIIDLYPGFIPVPAKLVIMEHREGNLVTWNIEAPFNKFVSQLDNLAKKQKISREDIVEQIANNEPKIYTKYIREKLSAFPISFGTENQCRAVVKASLVLWALITSNEEVRSSVFTKCRDFVASGGLKYNNINLLPIVETDYGPGLDNIAYGFPASPFDHYLAVWSDNGGNVYSYYRIFGSFGLFSRLLEGGATPRKGKILIQNPISGDSSYIPLYAENIPDYIKYDKIKNSDNDVRDAMVSIQVHCHNEMINNAMSQIIEQTMFDYGLEYEDIINPDDLPSFVESIATRFAMMCIGGKLIEQVDANKFTLLVQQYLEKIQR